MPKASLDVRPLLIVALACAIIKIEILGGIVEYWGHIQHLADFADAPRVSARISGYTFSHDRKCIHTVPIVQSLVLVRTTRAVPEDDLLHVCVKLRS